VIRILFFTIFWALLAGCLLTPPVFSILKDLWPQFPWPFSRVFDRVILVGGGVYLFFRRYQLRDLMPGQFGRPKLRSFQVALIGFALSLLPCLIVLPFIVGDEVIWKSESFAVWYTRFPKILATGFVVGLLEEFIFRRLLFGGLQTRVSVWMAMLITSLIYGTVHFIAPLKSYQYPGLSPFVGFEYLAEIFSRLLLPGIPIGIFGLFLVGLVLCEAVRRMNGHLALAVGLHAGWIFAVKLSFYATEVKPGTVFAEGLGRRYFLVAEPLVWLAIGVTYLGVRFLSSSFAQKSIKNHSHR
jgi:membrane protease YdiL (CAAX protease family)